LFGVIRAPCFYVNPAIISKQSPYPLIFTQNLKFLASKADIEKEKITNGNLSNKDWSAIMEAGNLLKKSRYLH